MKPKIVCVVGARPNFMKAAPIVEALEPFSDRVKVEIVHTGQHYDERMSGLLLDQLSLPEPDIHLCVGSGSHAVQTARIMMRFEEYCLEEKPALVLVVGDVNSTLACALTAVKLGIPVAHVEAGLRSRDRTMPEEINRIVTDSISDLLFTPSEEAGNNLRREGISPDRIHFVGNVMIDSLKRCLPKSRPPSVMRRLGEETASFGLVTLHRPPNVDRPEVLRSLIETLLDLSSHLPLIFPVHPRTCARLADLGYREAARPPEEGACLENSRLWITPPLGYLEFLYLMDRARVILTDSGGIQEEAVVLGTPCLTLRENTERPITLETGLNTLVGRDPERIRKAFGNILSSPPGPGEIPEKWDGSSSRKIASVLIEWLGSRSGSAEKYVSSETQVRCP